MLGEPKRRRSRAGLPIAAFSLGRDLADPDGSLARRCGVGSTGAVLVRPDGHVAWPRAAGRPDSRGELRRAVDAALARGRREAAPGLAS